MPIQVSCDKCGKKSRVSDEHAGKKAKCSCGALLSIPCVTHKKLPEATLNRRLPLPADDCALRIIRSDPTKHLKKISIHVDGAAKGDVPRYGELLIQAVPGTHTLKVSSGWQSYSCQCACERGEVVHWLVERNFWSGVVLRRIDKSGVRLDESPRNPLPGILISFGMVMILASAAISNAIQQPPKQPVFDQRQRSLRQQPLVSCR